MAAFRIAVLGGDGIGPEVTDQAIRVADAVLKREAATLAKGDSLAAYEGSRHRSRMATTPPGYSSGHASIFREPHAEHFMHLPTDGTGVYPGSGRLSGSKSRSRPQSQQYSQSIRFNLFFLVYLTLPIG